MKIRNGFVSNSSSSSFIVEKSDFKNTFNVAKKMIPYRNWKDQDTELLETIKKAEDKGIDKNISITFNSCNYDTFIKSTMNYIVIMTCNNHPFYEIFEDYNIQNIPKEVINVFEEKKLPIEYPIKILEDLDYKMYGHEYWMPIYNLFIKKINWDEKQDTVFPEKWKTGFCKKHFSEIVKLIDINEIYCPDCYIEENGIKPFKKIIIKKISRFELMDI